MVSLCIGMVFLDGSEIGIMVDGESDGSLGFRVGMSSLLHEPKCVPLAGTISRPKTGGHLAHETISNYPPIVHLQIENMPVDQFYSRIHMRTHARTHA